MTLLRRFRNRKRRSRGQSLVEFALTVPVLLVILMFAIDFGRAFFGWVVLQNSVRIAANYAALNAAADPWSSNSASVLNGYNDLVHADLDTANCEFVGALPEPVFTDGADTSVGDQTPDTSHDVGDTVKVSLTCTFKPITPIISGILGSSVQLGASSEFRIRAGDIAGLDNPAAIPPPVVPTPTPTAPPPPTPTPPPTPCARPTAAFVGAPVSGQGPNLAVAFTDQSTTTAPCPILGWAWDFGDGQTSTTQNPTHTFVKTGSGQQQRFTVELVVTVAGGVNDNERKVNYITVTK